MARGIIVRIRLTKDQKAQFMAAANEEGLAMSVWLRRLGVLDINRRNRKHAGVYGTDMCGPHGQFPVS